MKTKQHISEGLEAEYRNFLGACERKGLLLHNNFLRARQSDTFSKWESVKNIVQKLEVTDFEFEGDKVQYTIFGLLKLLLSLELLSLGMRSQNIKKLLSSFDLLLTDSNYAYMLDFMLLQAFLGVEITIYISGDSVQMRSSLEHSYLETDHTTKITIPVNTLLSRIFNNIPTIKFRDTMSMLSEETLTVLLGLEEHTEFKMVSSSLLDEYEYMGNLTVQTQSKSKDLDKINEISGHFENGFTGLEKHKDAKVAVVHTGNYNLQRIKKSLD